MDVVPGMPVLAVIDALSAWSLSKPSQDAEVPFQAMTSILAWARGSAAPRMLQGPAQDFTHLMRVWIIQRLECFETEGGACYHCRL